MTTGASEGLRYNYPWIPLTGMIARWTRRRARSQGHRSRMDVLTRALSLSACMPDGMIQRDCNLPRVCPSSSKDRTAEK